MQKILVAEDSFALGNLLKFALGNAGFKVELCRNGAAAHDAAMSDQYDLILLDQQMPKLSGVEVVEKIRVEGPNMSTPTFLCTAKTHELDLDYIQTSLKVIEVFHKPFSPKQLVERLQTVSATIDC